MQRSLADDRRERLTLRRHRPTRLLGPLHRLGGGCARGHTGNRRARRRRCRTARRPATRRSSPPSVADAARRRSGRRAGTRRRVRARRSTAGGTRSGTCSAVHDGPSRSTASVTPPRDGIEQSPVAAWYGQRRCAAQHDRRSFGPPAQLSVFAETRWLARLTPRFRKCAQRDALCPVAHTLRASTFDSEKGFP